MNTKMNAMNQKTAIHESGHILMALLLGCNWKFAPARPLRVEGKVVVGLVYLQKPKSTDGRIRVLLAAYVAEGLARLSICSKYDYREYLRLVKGKPLFTSEYVFAEQLLKNLPTPNGGVQFHEHMRCEEALKRLKYSGLSLEEAAEIFKNKLRKKRTGLPLLSILESIASNVIQDFKQTT